MPQRSSTDPSAPQLLDLHPALQATLRCMDVRLEDELARYRRDRRRSPIRPQSVAAAPEGVAANPGMASPSMLAIAPGFAGELEEEAFAPSVAASAGGFDPMAPPAEPEDYDDYLESSEHLLRSLAEDEADLRAEPAPRMLDTLLTPLGIGSMLLLLLSSVTLGYVITHPNGLPFATTEASEDAIAEPDSNLTLPDENNAVSDAPFTPDLSSQEFRDLNLDSLSTLPEDEVDGVTEGLDNATPSSLEGDAGVEAAGETLAGGPTSSITPAVPSPTAAAAPRPAAAPVRSPVAAAPSPRPPAAPAPSPRVPPAATSAPAPAPARSPAPSPVAAATPSPPQAYYYVVTDYTGDAALGAAQEVVPDAYVRNFSSGAVVQFGAFSEEDRASSLSQELQRQGISARVQRVER